MSVAPREFRPCLAVIAFLVPATLFGASQQWEVTYDHDSGKLECPNGQPTKRKQAKVGGCVLTVRAGDIILVQVRDSLPVVFAIPTFTRTDKPLSQLSQQQTGTIFGAGSGPPGVESVDARTLRELSLQRRKALAPGPHPVTDAYDGLYFAFTEVQTELNGRTFEKYGERRGDLERARLHLLSVLGAVPYEPHAIADAIKGELPALGDTSKEAIATSVAAIEAFRNEVPAEVSDLGATEEQLVDRDFVINCEIKSARAGFGGGGRSFFVDVRLRRAWTVSATTGFAFSGLVDDNYTTRTVIDTPATPTQPEVSHVEAVSQPRDAALPEVAAFINVTPFASSWDWLTISLGVGITTGASGRIYFGPSYRFGGGVWQITGGVAGGKVKRLSAGVDPNNLGTIDPQATRVDVFRPSAFAAVSYRVAQ